MNQLATTPLSPAYSVWKVFSKPNAAPGTCQPGRGSTRAQPRPRPARAGTGTADSLAMEPAGSAGGKEQQLALQPTNEQVVQWIKQTYGIAERRRVGVKADRALQALQAVEPDTVELSLQRDILPKIELLDSLSEGLGWRLFCRYPEEFAHPDAIDYWRIAAGCLFNAGLGPQQVASLLAQRPGLLAGVVRDPPHLPRLLDWLKTELGLEPEELARMIMKNPNVLSLDVEKVLRPRVRFLQSLGVPIHRIATAAIQLPGILQVDSALTQAKVDHLQSLGLSREDVGELFMRDSSSLNYSPERVDATLARLRERLPLPPDALAKLLISSGVLKFSPAGLAARLDLWEEQLGYSPEELARMVQQCPRLLLYPIDRPKYQAKLRFLEEYMGQERRSTILSFPQYITYSMERIATRAAAVRHLRPGAPMPANCLARSLPSFLKRYSIQPDEFVEFVAKWRQSEEGRAWLDGSSASGSGSSRNAGLPWGDRKALKAAREQLPLVPQQLHVQD